MRRSHIAYLGRGSEATVYRCTVCGTVEQGPPQDRGEAQRQRGEGDRRAGRRGRERPLPDGGSPDNPVIDSDMARLLRERFGAD
jgi:hypothetical protein